jgi:hypothetical protein
MSLLGVWLERKSRSQGPARPARLWKLALTLGVVLVLLVWLSRV